VARHDPGGLEVLDAEPAAFRAALSRRSHTLKRALTDPRILSGIGNAYSDEILHRARLSPFKLSGKIDEEQATRLYLACRMAVHGKFRKPCPDCGSPVQRVVYAANEANYCATCQTGGKLLADRALSRLLGKDWPRTWEELESLVSRREP